jgi:hypothetical protein
MTKYRCFILAIPDVFKQFMILLLIIHYEIQKRYEKNTPISDANKNILYVL